MDFFVPSGEYELKIDFTRDFSGNEDKIVELFRNLVQNIKKIIEEI